MTPYYSLEAIADELARRGYGRLPLATIRRYAEVIGVRRVKAGTKYYHRAFSPRTVNALEWAFLLRSLGYTKSAIRKWLHAPNHKEAYDKLLTLQTRLHVAEKALKQPFAGETRHE